MLFARVEKHGKYRDSWTLRRIAFDTETGHMYCTDKLENFRALWKHQIKVVRIIAKATVSECHFRDSNFDPRDLFSFRVEGSYRPIGSGIPSHYEQPTGSQADCTVIQKRTKADESENNHHHDEGLGNVLVWYMRTEKQEDFMKIYTTIRDVLIRDHMRPPQFWGLPHEDPRIQVPLAEPPLYLWYRFRTVKHSVFYACVHGHVAVRSADPSAPLKVLDEPMYLTVFDSSVIVFCENSFALAGIPLKDLDALHCATAELNVSYQDPANKKQTCFLSFLSRSKEYSDILFIPTIEPFAEPTAENVPAAQVKRVEFAIRRLSFLVQEVERENGGVDPIAIKKVKDMIDGVTQEAVAASNGPVDLYARTLTKQRGDALNLMDEDAFKKNKNKESSHCLIHRLPLVHSLSSLASALGIKMQKALTDYPSRDEYLSSEPTLCDPSAAQRKTALTDFFFFSGIY